MTAALKHTLSPMLAALALQAPPPPPASPQPQAPPLVFDVQASAVLVDVVVRDKKGRLVRDLTAADFELHEDGVRQQIDSFHVVDNRTAEEEAADAAPASPPGTETPPAAVPSSAPAAVRPQAPSVIAFVFDRMTVNARKQAEKIALAYTERGHVEGDVVGVFSIDLALRTLQPFTSKLDDVRLGLRRAGVQAHTAFAADREEARRRLDAVDRADEALSGLGGNDQTTGALIASQQALDAMQFSMLRTFDAMERDQQGFATTHGLMAVVNGLKRLPGRKTVVFFSEGIALPANVLGQFRSVIASANRANVSIYSIDAGGLRAKSGTDEAREEMVQGSQRRLRQEESGGTLATRGAMTQQLERNEDMLRLNPESGLGQLAEETGGFLIRDTNDARSGFGRISEDMRFHYLLAYSSTNERLDGGFRTIAVRLKRPDLRVQARKGYFAVRPDIVMPVRGYEAPALAELDRTPRPDAFPLGVAALSFPEPDRPGLVPVLATFAGKDVSWAPEGGAGFRAEFTVVARIRDARGREADRVSQDYRLAAPADKLEAARRGNVLFYREADVPPGAYTAEVVAYDAVAKAATVRTTAFEVPRADAAGLRLSSLVVVSRADKLSAEEQAQRKPLHFGEVILYPNMGEPFRKSSMPAVGFYFTVYGARDRAAAPRATIEIEQGGQVLAKVGSDLPPPDVQGRIQHAGTLSLEKLAPGSYKLKVAVGEGAAAVTRSASFVVAP